MSVLMFPLATEKCVNLISKENTITYIVHQKANKSNVKKEFEELYKVKVKSVNIVNTPTNDKKAYIKINKEFDASSIAIKLKLV